MNKGTEPIELEWKNPPKKIQKASLVESELKKRPWQWARIATGEPYINIFSPWWAKLIKDFNFEVEIVELRSRKNIMTKDIYARYIGPPTTQEPGEHAE